MDGRHLVDGLPFGRPWLRAPRDRPALDLPPRKRARITYDSDDDDEDEDEDSSDYLEDEDNEEESEPKQLFLEGPTEDPSSIGVRAVFDDADLDADNEEDGEEADNTISRPRKRVRIAPESDSESSDEELEVDEEELGNELKLLQADNDATERVNGLLRELSAQPPSSDLDLSTLDSITKLRSAFPSVPVNTIEAELLRCGKDMNKTFRALINKHEPTRMPALRSAFPLTSVETIEAELLHCDNDLRKTFQALTKRNEPTISFDIMMDRALFGTSDPLQSANEDLDGSIFKGFSSQDSLIAPFGGPSKPSRPLIEEVESTRVSGPSATNGRESEVTTVTLNISRSTNEAVEPSSDDTSSSSSEESSSSSEESSSESDSDDDPSESDSEDEADYQPASRRRPLRHALSDAEESIVDESDSSDSSDSSDRSDRSNSSDDSGKGGADVKDAADSSDDSSDDESSDSLSSLSGPRSPRSPSSSSSSSSEDSDSDSDEESEPEEVSARPKAAPAVQKGQDNILNQQAVAPVAPGCGLSRTQKRNARRREAKRLKQMQGAQSGDSMIIDQGEDPEFLARKRALLSVVSDESHDTPFMTPEGEASGLLAENVTEPRDQQVTEPVVETPPSAAAESTQRRVKVDMGAGRRMLFGALGLKNPKSKADEDKLRKNLMKDVRPLKNPRTEEATPKADDSEKGTEDDSVPWQDKINYSAVECCHDGMVLSEPPFPFVQRWDPQQQYNSMRKRKRDSQNFYDNSNYDESYDQGWYDDSQWYDQEQSYDGGGSKKKSKKRKSKAAQAQAEDNGVSASAAGDEEIILNYDDAPARERFGSSEFTDVEDLPSLPEDLTTLPILEQSNVKSGMVIAWKQLLMSKATNWQPQISCVTGLILSINDDGSFHLLLARRDREQNEKVYDEYTGKRVYDRFEAPYSDGEEDDEDDGHRDLAWSELSEPRLVQQAPATSAVNTPAKTSDDQAISDAATSEKNKVSESHSRDETVAEELGAQEVSAELEAQPGKGPAKATESDISASIPSGQHVPRLDLPDVNQPNSTYTTAYFTNMSQEYTNNHSRELGGSHDTKESDKTLLSQGRRSNNEIGEVTKVDGKAEQDVAMEDEEIAPPEPMALDESISEEIIPDSIPNITGPQRRSEKAPQSLATVDESALVAHSQVESVHSGRQPPSNYGLGESQDHVEDSIIPDTTPGAHEPRHELQDLPAGEVSDSGSSSPFPTLEEICQSATSSRQTQAAANSPQISRSHSLKRSVVRDLEYEEEMRKLDEGDESDSQDKNQSIRRLFPNATQPNPSLDLPELPALRPEESTRSRLERKTSPFKVPDGSQVISLSSSPAKSPKPALDKNRNEKPLPGGPGWVNKRDSQAASGRETKKEETARSTRSGRRTSSQGPSRTASAVSQIKARRRATKKF